MILAYVLLCCMIVVWSFNFILADYALEYIQPLPLALYRMIIASITFLLLDLYFKFSGKNEKKENEDDIKFTKNDWIMIVVASLLGQAFYFYFLYEAVGLIGPSLPALFVCLLSPVFIAILALIFFNEKLNNYKILGFIIATIGSFLLVTGGDLNNLTPKSPNFIGYMFALTVPILFAIYTISSKKASKGNSTYQILKIICYLTTIELFLLVLFTGGFLNLLEHLLTPIVLICAIYLGLLVHVIGFYIWQYSNEELDSSKAAAFLYIEPFLTLIFSFLLQRNETIVIWNIIGGIIVLFAVLLINRESPIMVES